MVIPGVPEFPAILWTGQEEPGSKHHLFLASQQLSRDDFHDKEIIDTVWPWGGLGVLVLKAAALETFFCLLLIILSRGSWFLKRR